MFSNILDLDKGLESKSMESLPLSIFFVGYIFFFLKQIYKVYMIEMLHLLVIHIGRYIQAFTLALLKKESYMHL